MTLSPIEREAIGLCICCDALSALLNHSMQLFSPVMERPDEMEVRFQTSDHRELFLIRLQDFVSEQGSATLLGQKASCLDVLSQAAHERHLAPGPSGNELERAVLELTTWFDTSIRPKLWLSSISVEARISVSRRQLLKISGNQAKHNPSRLTGVSSELQRLLEEQGHTVPIEMIPFVLEDLREHLGANLFIYYGTWIAELLNNIRWAIQIYLAPAYARAYRSLDHEIPGLYRFDPPPGILPSTAPQMWFHALMNHVRSRPFVGRFRTSKSLREKSSLEWPDDELD